MAARVDLSTWPRADQFRFFRSYDRPHYATSVRLDMSHVMRMKADHSLSPYRAALFAIGAGIHGVPELLMRFRGDVVWAHDGVELSFNVPTPAGSFNYAYLPFDPDFASFDKIAQAEIARAAAETQLDANKGDRDDLAYLSCMPWLDYTSINNALSGPDDCIPRVSWGKIVPKGSGFEMAMTLEVHHALVDGAQVGAFFQIVQEALLGLSAEN